MNTVVTIRETESFLGAFREQNKKIGFVPTMGALHKGHLSLLQAARSENDCVVCSIFVNPLQFNNPDDLKRYPRNLEKDIPLLESVDCDLLFSPSEQEIYPEPDHTVFDFGELDKVMEGKHRPGHFNGVAVVVKKLLEIVKPHAAYFGMKDYQQLLIVHKLIGMCNLNTEIIPCPIVREPDGLAMSSRNALLSRQERKMAPVIYEALKLVKLQAGFLSIREMKRLVEDKINRTKYLRLEYFEITDMYTLKPLQNWTESRNIIACIAVWAGNVRLIDNIILFS